MKTYIIYNEELPYSKKIAQECLNSFSSYEGWEPELYRGCSPLTLKIFNTKYKMKTNRKNKIRHDSNKFKSKKACFYSHYTLWLKCIELDEPISILEHDTECVLSVNNINFKDIEGVLQLTTESVLESNTWQGQNFPQDLKLLREKGPGIFPTHSSHKLEGYRCVAGNTGYCISPKAAATIVAECKKFGWHQNDLIMTTKLFPIYYIVPSPIKYLEHKERRTSTFWKKQ